MGCKGGWRRASVDPGTAGDGAVDRAVTVVIHMKGSPMLKLTWLLLHPGSLKEWGNTLPEEDRRIHHR